MSKPQQLVGLRPLVEILESSVRSVEVQRPPFETSDGSVRLERL